MILISQLIEQVFDALMITLVMMTEKTLSIQQDRVRAERVVSGGNTAANSAEELTISIPPEFRFLWNLEDDAICIYHSI